MDTHPTSFNPYGMSDQELDVRMVLADDETVAWLQLKSTTGKKLTAEEVIMGLELWLNDAASAGERETSLGLH